MTAPASTEPGAPPGTTAGWRVRAAGDDDVGAVAAAVEELLVELGGRRPALDALEEEARALIDGPQVGALLVAEAEGKIVGLLAASWQRAMHVPGRYGTIQDLWVHPDWRSRAIGADLVAALAALAGERGIARLEVGLPRESFAGLAKTEAFYRRNGFDELGIRMRRLLS